MQKEIKRKCQGCMGIFDRSNLIKITKLADNTLKINPNSSELGRSIYVCKNKECIEKFIKKNRLKNSLKFYNLEEIKKAENALLEML